MSSEREHLEAAISALEAQRTVLGDAVLETALAPLRARLAAIDAPALGAMQSLKQVTILFLDVVGSTALSETLDPEEIHAVMDGALKRGTRIVESHRGKVFQYAGDNIMGVFGAEQAQEDDAEHAVRCGLELLELGRTLGTEVESTHGHAGFNVRVGIHTGGGLIGGKVNAQGNIWGVAVNIAARMEQTAPAGGLRISHDTYRHVRGIFDVEAQPPLQVKGVHEALRTYFVLKAKPRAFRVPTRGIEGAETPLVGRETELAQLSTAFEATRTEGGLRAVTVLAEAGIGKSRLMHEMQYRLDTHLQSCWLLLGRSQPSSSNQPYGLLRDVLAWRLQIADSDSGESARRQLVEGLAPLFAERGELQAELLGQLIGMDFSASPRLAGILKDPRLLRDRAFAAFTNYVEALTASDGSPVVMLLDDLHWADDASLDWLQNVMQQAELPLTLIMTARPELRDRRPAWGDGCTTHQRIDLAPLDQAQRQALTSAMLRHLAEIPATLRAIIERQAEGNPFYAEELVKMFIDDGVIVVEGDVWRVLPDKLEDATIPGTLTGVLQARIDALTGKERRALQAASVVGPVFWDDAVSRLDPAAPDSLPQLRERAMVQIHTESAFAGVHEERFQHHLLHQVTYDTVLKADRRAGHARAAQWLAERVGDREAEYLAVTAQHYERAGDAARASEWYERAAIAAEGLYANRLALDCLARILSLGEPKDRRHRCRLLFRRAGLADLTGDRTLQSETLEECIGLADALGDDPLRARVIASQGLLADRIGQGERAWDLASTAAELAQRCAAAAPAALAHGELAWLCNERGELPKALEHIEIALRWAREAALAMVSPGDDVYEPQLYCLSGIIYHHQFDYERATAAFEHALRLARSNHLRVAASCHEALAIVALELTDLDLAAHHSQTMAALAHEIGHRVLEASAVQQSAELALSSGDCASAVALASEAALAYAKLGSGPYQAKSLTIEASAWSQLGNWSAARDAQQRAHDTYALHNRTDDTRASRLLIADYLRNEGGCAPALAAIEAELEFIDEVGSLDPSHSPLAARMAAWRVLDANADPRASRQLELAITELRRRTDKISDPTVRARVIEGVPLHCEIVTAWHARQGSTA